MRRGRASPARRPRAAAARRAGSTCREAGPGESGRRGARPGGRGASAARASCRRPRGASASQRHPPPLFHRSPPGGPSPVGVGSGEEPLSPAPRPRRATPSRARPSLPRSGPGCAEGDSGLRAGGLRPPRRTRPAPGAPRPGRSRGSLLSGVRGALWDAPRGWKGRGLQVISCRSTVCHWAGLLELPKGEIQGRVDVLRRPGIFFSLAGRVRKLLPELLCHLHH